MAPISFFKMTEKNTPSVYIPDPPRTNGSFSGSDVDAYILAYGKVSGDRFIPIKNLAAISWSSHRDKAPVRALGTSVAKSYTKGTRTIAGSIVLVNFDRTGFYELIEGNDYDPLLNETKEGVGTSSVYGDLPATNIKYADDIPPFDIMLLFKEEKSIKKGTKHSDPIGSKLMLRGIRLVDEGAVTGTEESHMETTFQYVAEEVDYLRPLDANKEAELVRATTENTSSNIPISRTAPYLRDATSYSVDGYLILATLILDGDNVDVTVNLQEGRVYSDDLTEAVATELDTTLKSTYITGHENISKSYCPVNIPTLEASSKIADWTFCLVKNNVKSCNTMEYGGSVACFNAMKVAYYKHFSKSGSCIKTIKNLETRTLDRVTAIPNISKTACEEMNSTNPLIKYTWTL